MGALGWIIGIGVLGTIIHKSNKVARENAEENARRRGTECLFADGFSESEFEMMAKRASQYIKRLSISVKGPIIYGTVRSQSGISEWKFTADFNDYGHITGRYWLSSENSESNVPSNFSNSVAELIRNYDPEEYISQRACRETGSLDTSQSHKFEKNYCPNCGNRVSPDSLFCSSCGKRLT